MTIKEKNFMSAIVYVHNAEDRIEEFLTTLMDVLEMNFEHSEIICVNDGSDDASVKKIKEISIRATTSSISVLNMSYFHGLEAAMNAGMDLAIGDFVLEFDSTVLDFDKSEIMRVYRHSLKGYDIVSASPDTKVKFGSKCFYTLFERFGSFAYKMTTESFRVLSRRVINRIGSMNKSVPYRKAVYANCGLKTDNLVYSIKHQSGNNNRIENRYKRHLAVDAMILFTDFGYRFSIAMTTIMMLMALLMVGYSVAIYLTNNPVEGWTTTILFLSLAFFGLFGVLTIIIKYLQILVELVFRRKRYSFESIQKLTK